MTSKPASASLEPVLDTVSKARVGRDRRGALGVHAFQFALLLAAYNLVVIERYDRILLGRGPFLQRAVLGVWEKVFFCLMATLETLVFVATLSLLVSFCFGRIRRIPVWLPPALVSAGYVAVITAQFRVLQYFKDGIDLAVIRSLGGGSLSSALHYVWLEVAAVLPLLLALVAVVGVLGYSLHRWHRGGPLLHQAASRWLVPKRLLAANFAVWGLTVVVALVSPDTNRVLDYVPSHYVYKSAANYATDWDRDGWGLLDTPRDFAPFDASRHPYAVEIPGNGIDEDGVGGDLPLTAVNERRLKEERFGEWEAAKLEPRNVLLIVVESARADLLDAEVDGRPVMPALRQLTGSRLAMFSNSGYTATSSIAMMTGALCGEDRLSLIQRFRKLGYQTGVFSGQNESFGRMDAQGHFEEADVLVDARKFPDRLRMYTSTAAGALAVPTPLVNSAFQKWCSSRKRGQPFFAYLDWQELHFPYYHDGGPRPLIPNPIPRNQILPENRGWLRRTYDNGARSIDDGVAEIVGILRSEQVFEQTVILIIGDHGEELFDHGRLGHGTSICFEQNAVLCKLVNSRWQPPPMPIGSSDVTTILHNSLVRSPADALELDSEVLCYTGTIRQPSEVGLITPTGLLKYNFRRASWSGQTTAGQALSPATPADRVIHAWESLLVLHPATRNH
jgi:hypothetical protein